MEYYEKYFRTYQEAKKTAIAVNGKIYEFISSDENMQPITIYKVVYKVLF